MWTYFYISQSPVHVFKWLAQLVHVMFHCVVRQGSLSSCKEWRTKYQPIVYLETLQISIIIHTLHEITLYELIDVHLHQLTN